MHTNKHRKKGKKTKSKKQVNVFVAGIRECNTLHCNTLQHTATHRNTLQRTATHCNALQHTATHCNTLHQAATHCNTLQHTATLHNTLQHIATHYNTQQHTATLYNTLQTHSWCVLQRWGAAHLETATVGLQTLLRARWQRTVTRHWTSC